MNDLSLIPPACTAPAADSAESAAGAVAVRSCRLGLPLLRYRLRLHHPLLDSLGQLSHYLLRQLRDGPLLPAQLQQATGLTRSELEPVVLRLERLELLRSATQGWQLSDTGRRMADALHSGLHNSRRVLWFDGLSPKRPAFLLWGDAPACVHTTADPRVAHLPIEQRHPAERFLAHQQALERSPGRVQKLRSLLWPQYASLLEAADERGGRATGWALSLEESENPLELAWLPLELPAHTLRRADWWTALDQAPPLGASHRRLDLHAWRWHVAYACPEGWPEATDLPDPLRLSRCSVSGQPLDVGTGYWLDKPGEHCVPASWQTPLDTVVPLFEADTPPVAPRWTRHVTLASLWQPGWVQVDDLIQRAQQQHAEALFALTLDTAA